MHMSVLYNIKINLQFKKDSNKAMNFATKYWITLYYSIDFINMIVLLLL